MLPLRSHTPRWPHDASSWTEIISLTSRSMICVATRTCQGASFGLTSGLECATLLRFRFRAQREEGAKSVDRAHGATSAVIRYKPPWRLLRAYRSSLSALGISTRCFLDHHPKPAARMRTATCRRRSLHSRAWTRGREERRPSFSRRILRALMALSGVVVFPRLLGRRNCTF